MARSPQVLLSALADESAFDVTAVEQFTALAALCFTPVFRAAACRYAVSDPSQSIEALSKFVDDVIGRELSTVPGVGKTSRIGGADREIKVDLDPDRLLAHGLTAADQPFRPRLRRLPSLHADAGRKHEQRAPRREQLEGIDLAAEPWKRGDPRHDRGPQR